MVDTITIKQLASKAGMEVRTLRRILRAKFTREVKGKAYEWQANDPQVDLILQAASDHKSRARKVSYDASDQKTVKPTTKKMNGKTKATKKQPKTQKPNATKTEETNDLARKGGEEDDNKAANS
jgi:hypothetical protein